MIRLKTLFGGWQEVDCRTAKYWAWDKWHGITNMPDAEKLAYINDRLDGVQFTQEELEEPQK